jgi:D-tyrosyl-tRNA(Tyr) deacylase
MKVLLQRVLAAHVESEGRITGAIGPGLLVFAGIDREDDAEVVVRMAARVIRYRLFADDRGRMNRSLLDLGLPLLAVSQFTLSADTTKGLRPGFSAAAAPAEAQQLFNSFVGRLREAGVRVETGVFGADMQVHLVNDGPVTFWLTD